MRTSREGQLYTQRERASCAVCGDALHTGVGPTQRVIHWEALWQDLEAYYGLEYHAALAVQCHRYDRK